MVTSRKSRRYSRKAKRRSTRRSQRQRKQRGGGTVTIHFMLAQGGAVSNMYSSDPGFTVEAATPASAAGKINLKGTSTSKITGVEIKAIPTGGAAAGWANQAGLMNAVHSGTSKVNLSKGTVSLVARTAIAIPAAGVALTDALNITNLLGTANWSGSKQPDPTGAVPPGGSSNANIRLVLTTNP